MCFFSKEKREERKRKKEEKKLLRQQKKEEKLKAKQGKAEQPQQEQPEKEKVTKNQEKPVATIKEEKQTDKQEEIVIESKECDGKKERPINYHISRREDGKWQVKRAKGGRALKLFSTQAEAIAFAKERAESMDASITIHKKDGKIRKQKYGKKN